MLLVVTYDIADDRRRTRLFTLLHGYGAPVQRSVFECDVTDEQYRELRQRVRRVIRPRVDDVRYYPLCARCAERVIDANGQRRDTPPDAIVV